MPSHTLALRESVDPADLHPVAYQAAVLAALLVLVGLATLLPGADRTVPGAGVSIGQVVVAIGTAAVVVLLALAARTVSTTVRSVLEGPEDLVADAGRTAGALVVFAAVLVAYRGFAGVVVPRLAAGDAVWAYDAAFLALAVVPLAVVARRLWRNLDEVAGHVAETVAARTASGDRRTEV